VAGALLTVAPCAAQSLPAGTSAFPLACSFASTSGELDFEQACAAMDGTTLVLAPHVISRLDHAKGLSRFAVPGSGWHYRRRDGTTQRMYMFDNGPDDFVEGLARAIVAGKIAYVDRHLRIRIAPRYDWGDRFDHGRAEVCIGCRSVPVGDGEHSVMEGGRWGMIDKSGREVVPVKLSQVEFVARRNGVR
jgi:hypothetical protein